jgi:putative ABC transport system permease protein
MNNLVFSNMLHRPARTAVSIVGIGIGILLIVFTIGLAEGSLRGRAQQEANVGAEIFFRAAGAIGLSGSESFKLSVALVPELEKTEGVARVVTLAQNTAAAKDTNSGNRLIDGINYDEYAEVAGLKIIEGRKFVDGADEVMADTAWLQMRKYKVGDTLSLYERDFKIVGSYEPAAGARIKIPLSTMQAQLGGEGKGSAFLIKVKDGFTPEQTAQNLQNKFPDNQIFLTSQLEDQNFMSVPLEQFLLTIDIGAAAPSAR